MSVDLRVLGVPAPQGSKTRMPNGALVEGGSATGRAKHRAWRTAVAEAAAHAMTTRDAPLDGPLQLAVEFRLPRPASARKGKHWADRKPDLSKLLRSTEDGLTDGGLIADDARICYISASKQLADPSDPWTGAVIRLTAFDDRDAYAAADEIKRLRRVTDRWRDA